MQGQANVKLQQNFELAGGYVQKVLEQYNYKNISIRSPRTSFFVPKVTNEVLEFMSVEKISQAFMPRSYEKDFY